MWTKLSIILLSGFLLLAVKVQAIFIINTASLQIVVNSGPEPATFNVRISTGNLGIDIIDEFDLTTDAGKAEYSIELPVFNSSQKYYIRQNSPEGTKLVSVVCVTDDSENISENMENGVKLTLQAFSSTTCTFNNQIKQNKNPVVFIPGILGTEMLRDSESLWLDVNRLVLTNNDHFMDPLAFNVDGVPIDTDVRIGKVLDQPHEDFDYTYGLKQEFLSQGYEVDKNLFFFPYDWREDITKTANIYLKQKIDEIASSTKASKIDIIAHSQGGLVIKKLLLNLPEYQNKIGKLIFLGTPHLGAPKAAKVLLYGDSMGVSYLKLGLDPNELKLIGKNIPAVYQLLPSQEYFKHSSGYYGTMETPWFKDPKITLYDYETTKDKLKAEGLNPELLDKAESFHIANFDNFDFSNTSIDTYNIMGCVSPTLNSMLVKKRDFDKLVYGPGDGTVPIFSASNTIATKNFYFINPSDIHGKMPSIDGVRQKIVNIITGSNFNTPNITDNVTECQFDGQQVSIHSPVDIHIYDSQGNHTGPLSDGNFENQIPGVAYDIIGEEKFVFLPKDQIFTIKLVATDAGTFSLNTSIIENGQTITTAHYDSIGITATSTAQLLINEENNQTINFTSDDRVIKPSAILNSQQAKDSTPPVSTSTISGILSKVNQYKGNVKIKLESADVILEGQETETSGLLSIYYQLDKKGYILYPTSTEVSIASVGEHTLEFYGVDRVGNKESSQSINFIILAEDKEPAVILAGGSGGGGNIGGGRDTNSAISSPNIGLPEVLPQVLGLATTTSVFNVPKTTNYQLFLEEGTVYLVINHTKRPFASQVEFLSYGFTFQEVKPINEEQKTLPLGRIIKARPGTLIYDINKKLYLISENFEKQKDNIIT
jgi:pimeloyl-ACP methyl ester carboxylesterase